MGEDVVTHDAASEGAGECLAKRVAIVPTQCSAGGFFVHAPRFENETYLLEGHGHGIVPHFLQIQRQGLFGCIAGSIFRTEFTAAVKEYLPALLHIYIMCMLVRKDGDAAVLSGATLSLDIEFVGGIFLQGDVDALCLHQFLACLDVLGSAVCQHLKFSFGLTDECTEGNGDGETRHARTGNADAHGVFEDIGTETYVYALGLAAQEFTGTGDSQCDANGLGATHSGHDFTTHQRRDFFFFFF